MSAFVAYLLPGTNLVDQQGREGRVQLVRGNPTALLADLRKLGCEVFSSPNEQRAWRWLFEKKGICGACAGHPDLNQHRCDSCASRELEGKLAASLQANEARLSPALLDSMALLRT